MRSMRDHHDSSSYPHRRRTQSFSSTLLDSIYRSTDESKSNLDDEIQKQSPPKQSNYKQSILMEKQSGGIGKARRMNLRRAVMMEDWMEKQSTLFLNSSSSETEYSVLDGKTEYSVREVFSSSETEKKKKKTKNKKTEKLKQPISPGSRIASFLSSIFNSGNVKKAKMCYVGAVEDVNFDRKSKSPCFSSVSSVSRRSCMSNKTPKGKKKNSSNNVNKRCVRFYPVSVILGETEKSEFSYDQSDPKFSRNCSIEKSGKLNFRGIYDVDEEDDDDGVSCSSSDLFELDHIVGGGRYKEELPVYETTDLETNKAIANGLHL